jgi:hypothetical protein
MIVTKELAKKYILKRAAWFIEIGPDGNYMMALRSQNWLEGMELFENEEECLEEIQKRRAAKMGSGYCPRCNYRADETDKDISYLNLISEPKGSKIYQCPKCQSAWFTKDGWTNAKGYDNALLDYIIEWSDRKMSPSEDQLKILKNIGNISRDASYELYPAHVVLKNGKEFPTAMIQLQTEPPPPKWFEDPVPTAWSVPRKMEWHYFDLVKELRPSEFAYPSDIAAKIMKTIWKGNFQFMYVQDLASKTIYSFECHAGIFFPQELRGKDLKLLEGREPSADVNYFMPHERRGPDTWNLTPPPDSITIWGDRT